MQVKFQESSRTITLADSFHGNEGFARALSMQMVEEKQLAQKRQKIFALYTVPIPVGKDVAAGIPQPSPKIKKK